MSKTVKIILGIAVCIVVIIGILSFLPRDFQVERSITVSATPEQIHPYVNSFHLWRKWSAPAERDSKVEYSYQGPNEGTGAKQTWKGKDEHGFTVITKSDPQKGVWIETAYNSDQVNGSGTIQYEKVEAGTRVIRTAKGKMPPIVGPIYKAEVESNLRDYYDHSLSTMKQVIESELQSKQ